jgi:ECF transporter S component (folate family)
MNQSSSVRVTVFCGLFIALSVVLTRLASVTVPIAGFPSVRLGFGLAPVILAGVLFGPGAGFLVGRCRISWACFLFPRSREGDRISSV